VENSQTLSRANVFSYEKETLTRIPLAWPEILKSSIDWNYSTVYVYFYVEWVVRLTVEM